MRRSRDALVLAMVIVPLLVYWYGSLYPSSDPLSFSAATSPSTTFPSASSSPPRSPPPTISPSSSSSPSRSARPTTSPSPSSVVQPPKLNFDPHLHIAWNDYVSTSGRLRVMSAAQDHRRFPPRLAAAHPFAFPAVNKLPYAKIFQFQAAHPSGDDPFTRAAIWIYSLMASKDEDKDSEDKPLLPLVPAHQRMANDSGQAIDDTGKFVVTKLDLECINHRPNNWAHRSAMGARNSDLIVRCIAFLTPEMVDQSLCVNSFARHHANSAECRVGHVVMHDIDGGMLHFPMDKIMHYPDPVSLLPPTMDATGFSMAPWRATGQASPPVKRATGDAEAAKVRTCVWVPKKYSWDAADELWLLWMLDVVGVDFVSINFVPSQFTGYEGNAALFNTTTTLGAVRKRIDAQPGLGQRVLLVQSDIPGSPITFDHMVNAMHWDGFVRLQADCDYGFSIDPDEFIDLYDVEPPHERVDIKTFIAQRNATLDVQEAVCMQRLMMRRETLPGVADETMAPFLVRWLHYESANQSRIAHTLHPDGLGKCLWKLRGNLKPYLHYPEERYLDAAGQDDIDLSHMLHIRLHAGYAVFNDKDKHPDTARPQDL